MRLSADDTCHVGPDGSQFARRGQLSDGQPLNGRGSKTISLLHNYTSIFCPCIPLKETGRLILQAKLLYLQSSPPPLQIPLLPLSPKHPQVLSFKILKVCSPVCTFGFFHNQLLLRNSVFSDRHIIQPTRNAGVTNRKATTHGQQQIIHCSYSK